MPAQRRLLREVATERIEKVKVEANRIAEVISYAEGKAWDRDNMMIGKMNDEVTPLTRLTAAVA